MEAIAYLGADPGQVAEYKDSLSRGVHLIDDSAMKALLGSAGFSNPFRFFQTILINGWFARKP